MRRAAVGIALLLCLACLGCARAAPTPVATPTPVDGPIPAAVDDAFCDLAMDLEPLSASLVSFGQAISDEGFSAELIRREAPVVRNAIATVAPYLPVIARWAPTASFANELGDDLRRLDEGVAEIERDEDNLIALAGVGLALRDVEAAFRDDLPLLRIDHPEIACPGASG